MAWFAAATTWVVDRDFGNLVNFCFQSEVGDKSYLIAPSLIEEMLNFIGSSLFCLPTFCIGGVLVV